MQCIALRSLTVLVPAGFKCPSCTLRCITSDVAPPECSLQVPYPTDLPRAKFKAEAIRTLIEGGQYGEVVAGVGDRPSDMHAYVQNGLRWPLLG